MFPVCSSLQVNPFIYDPFTSLKNIDSSCFIINLTDWSLVRKGIKLCYETLLLQYMNPAHAQQRLECSSQSRRHSILCILLHKEERRISTRSSTEIKKVWIHIFHPLLCQLTLQINTQHRFDGLLSFLLCTGSEILIPSASPRELRSYTGLPVLTKYVCYSLGTAAKSSKIKEMAARVLRSSLGANGAHA